MENSGEQNETQEIFYDWGLPDLVEDSMFPYQFSEKNQALRGDDEFSTSSEEFQPLQQNVKPWGHDWPNNLRYASPEVAHAAGVGRGRLVMLTRPCTPASLHQPRIGSGRGNPTRPLELQMVQKPAESQEEKPRLGFGRGTPTRPFKLLMAQQFRTQEAEPQEDQPRVGLRRDSPTRTFELPMAQKPAESQEEKPRLGLGRGTPTRPFELLMAQQFRTQEAEPQEDQPRVGLRRDSPTRTFDLPMAQKPTEPQEEKPRLGLGRGTPTRPLELQMAQQFRIQEAEPQPDKSGLGLGRGTSSRNLKQTNRWQSRDTVEPKRDM